MEQVTTWQGRVAAVWGVAGVIALLGFAIYRLAPFGVELVHQSLHWWHYVALLGWCIFMAYTEGYQAFYKQFSPRVVARAQYLLQGTTPRRTVLAPLFCVGYFGAPKHRIVVAYGLVVGIVGLITIVHFIPQPWRGIIDVGVVLGLVLGIVSIVFYSLRALRRPFESVAEAEVPA